MSTTRIVISGIAFAALVVLLVWDQRRIERLDRERTQAERLIPFERDDIDAISIDRLRDSVRLVRDKGIWTLKEPLETAADMRSMNELLYYLDKQQRIGAIDATSEQLAAFGLDQAPLRVSVESSGGDAVRFNVGERSPVHGEAYASLEGDNATFTIAAELKDWLASGLYELRDKALVAFNANEATTLTLLVQGESPVRAVREEADWFLDQPLRAPADENAVNGILHALHLTRAQDFVDTDTLNLQRFGLDVPTVVAHLEAKGNPEARSSTLTIGKARDGTGRSYYARRNDRTSIFAVPEGLVYELLPDVGKLRATEIFTLAGNDIREFTLEFAGDTIHLVLDSEGLWRFDSPEGERADQTVANEALRFLLTMHVEVYLDYQPTLQMAGLDDPRLRVSIGDGSGTTEFIETGRTGKGDSERGFVYARNSEEGEIFGVPLELPGKLFLTREKFQDKTLYAFDPDQVGSLKYTVTDPRTGTDAAYLFVREEGGWRATAVRTAEEAQVARNVVESLLLHMLALRWNNRLDPNIKSEMTIIKSSALDQPPLLLEVFDRDQNLITTLGLGPQPNPGLFHVRRDRGGRADYFTIERTAFLPFATALRELLRP